MFMRCPGDGGRGNLRRTEVLVSVLSWLETAKDVGSFAIKEPYEKVVDGAEFIGDGVAAGYDYLTGDTEHAKEHLIDAGFDAAEFIAPPGVDHAIGAAKVAKDVGSLYDEHVEAKEKGYEPDDYGGEGAKYGGILGALLGPVGIAEGAAVGGLLGSALSAHTAPKLSGGNAQKMLSSVSNIGKSVQLDASQGVPFGPPKPTPMDNVNDYLAKHPFGHYAF
jgi:hypothetical protein